MKKIYNLVLVLLIIGLSSPVKAQFDMLYVTKPENSVDIALIDYFHLEGYNVTEVLEADFKAEGSIYATAAGYDGFDVLFVSESIGSSSANNYKNAGFPIPSVATEGFAAKTSRWGLLADDSDSFFKQASSADLTADVLTLEILDNSNWITQIYDQGDQLMWADAADPTKLGVTSFDLSVDIPAAQPLAAYLFDMGDLSAVWAIPDGSMMRETDILPNMVLIGAIQSDVGQTYTGEFQEFLVRCIRWVTGDYEATAIQSIEEKKMVVGPNPSSGIVDLHLTLSMQGEVNVNIYDMTGRLLDSKNRGTLNSGTSSLQVDFSGLVHAQYILEVVAGNEVLRTKIIKQ